MARTRAGSLLQAFASRAGKTWKGRGRAVCRDSRVVRCVVHQVARLLVIDTCPDEDPARCGYPQTRYCGCARNAPVRPARILVLLTSLLAAHPATIAAISIS